MHASFRIGCKYLHRFQVCFWVIHDFGVIWQTRKFLTSAGSHIKHAGLVKDLMFAMKIPKKLAVIKVKAHLTTNTTEAKGNALADCSG